MVRRSWRSNYCQGQANICGIRRRACSYSRMSLKEEPPAIIIESANTCTQGLQTREQSRPQPIDSRLPNLPVYDLS